MKWFKHASDANMNHKVQELILDHGVTGYGLYFYCLELIASGVCPDNVRFELRHDPRVIGRNLNVPANDVVQILDRCVELGLFEKNENIYSCPKMAEKTDDYTQKLTRKKNNSGECPDKIRKSPPRLDKNRLDKNSNKPPKSPKGEAEGFQEFWDEYPNKVAKQKALSAFKKIKPDRELLERIISDVRRRAKSREWLKDGGQFIPHPTTYLNQQRWEDEQPKLKVVNNSFDSDGLYENYI